jgi:hypothetical protein
MKKSKEQRGKNNVIRLGAEQARLALIQYLRVCVPKVRCTLVSLCEVFGGILPENILAKNARVLALTLRTIAVIVMINIHEEEPNAVRTSNSSCFRILEINSVIFPGPCMKPIRRFF